MTQKFNKKYKQLHHIISTSNCSEFSNSPFITRHHTTCHKEENNTNSNNPLQIFFFNLFSSQDFHTHTHTHTRARTRECTYICH